MTSDELAIRTLYTRNVAALSAGDIAALTALYTDDAIQLPPNAPPLVGWAAISSSLKNELAGVRAEANVEVLETTTAGSWAFARGTYRTVVVPRNGGPQTDSTGNWLDILKRQEDGSWKIARSTWTNDPL